LRHNYYGTSYVDADFGGAIHDSDEEEALQLEEQDALARQHKLENTNACLDFDQFFRKDYEFIHNEDDDSITKCELADLLQIEVQYPVVPTNASDCEEKNLGGDEVIF
jgi:hypothetical protein